MDQIVAPERHKEEGDSTPYELIARGLKRGRIVPFFGSAASAVYNRQGDEPWAPGKPFMPFGKELAMTLARFANYQAGEAALAKLKRALEGMSWQSDGDRQQVLAMVSQATKALAEEVPDLAFIASWFEQVQGTRDDINDILHEAFAVDCPPGLLQTTIADIPATRLYVTTNYDQLLDEALKERQPHLIVDRGGNQGLLVKPWGKETFEVQTTGDRIYELLDDEESQKVARPILFKMHGSVSRDPNNDCYLITEEDYVDFLGRDKGHYVPPYIEAMMRNKDFLFLGYSLTDWNVRVILRKLLKGAATARRYRAIASGISPREKEVWEKQGLNIHEVGLKVFAEKLAEELKKKP
jgi:SIR2-like domain